MTATRVRPVDHTGDIGFELSASDLATLFDAARRALLAQLMATPPEAGGDAREDGGPEGGTAEKRLLLQAPAVDRLLLRWLDELLYQVQTCGRVPARAPARVTPPAVGGGAWRLDARLTTVPLDAEAHGWRGEIKGVTYHGLHVERRRDGWQARVILDV